MIFLIIKTMSYFRIALVCSEETEQIWNKEVYVSWRWHFSPKKDPEPRCTASEQEWAQQTAERYWLPEEQKEEKYYPLRSQLCDLFFFLKKGELDGKDSFFKEECGISEGISQEKVFRE